MLDPTMKFKVDRPGDAKGSVIPQDNASDGANDVLQLLGPLTFEPRTTSFPNSCACSSILMGITHSGRCVLDPHGYTRNPLAELAENITGRSLGAICMKQQS